MHILSRLVSGLSWPTRFTSAELELKFQVEYSQKASGFYLVAGLAGLVGYGYFFALWAITRGYIITGPQLGRLTIMLLSSILIYAYFAPKFRQSRFGHLIGPGVFAITLVLSAVGHTTDVFIHRTPTLFAIVCILYILLSCPLWRQTAKLNMLFLCFVLIVWMLRVHQFEHLQAYFTREFVYILVAGLAAFYLALQTEQTDRQLFIQRINIEQAQAIAEAANRSKSDFLAAVSHDLRQPLTALALWTERVPRLDAKGERTAVAQEMGRSVSALRSMLDALLDLSRIDAKAISINLQPVMIAPLLEGIASEYQDRALAKGLQLTVNIPIDVACLTDALHFGRLLRNLVHNAITYTNAGSVTLAAVRSTGDEICVSVTDTGAGIPLELQDRVFDEYFQVSNPDRDRSAGLGLGLSIVRRLAVLLGHRLALTSNVGVGTKFEVFAKLPRL
jgi:signal transduction histidine kinase